MSQSHFDYVVNRRHAREKYARMNNNLCVERKDYVDEEIRSYRVLDGMTCIIDNYWFTRKEDNTGLVYFLYDDHLYEVAEPQAVNDFSFISVPWQERTKKKFRCSFYKTMDKVLVSIIVDERDEEEGLKAKMVEEFKEMIDRISKEVRNGYDKGIRRDKEG